MYLVGSGGRHLSQKQREIIEDIKAAIKIGGILCIKVRCLCGCPEDEEDLVLSEEEWYGLPIQTVCCYSCGLVRNTSAFDEQGLALFYEKYYRPLYSNGSEAAEVYFNGQIGRGKIFIELLKKCGVFKEINKIFEIGCGAGGVLYPFKLEGKDVSGCDFDQDYLEFGKIGYGLNLIKPQPSFSSSDKKYDCVIIAHVLEHVVNPLAELKNALEVLKEGGYLLIEVPGIYSNKYYLPDPHSWFHVAHIFNFHSKYFEIILPYLGCEIISIDQRITIVARKITNQEKNLSLEHSVFERIGSKKSVESPCMLAYVEFNIRNKTEKILWRIKCKFKNLCEKLMNFKKR